MEHAAEPPEERVEFDLAPTSARTIARAVDLIMIVVGGLFIAAALTVAGVIDQDKLEASDSDVDPYVAVSFLAGALLYEVPLNAMRGKTLGKMLTRSKLISATGDGPPRWGAAAVRAAVWVIPVLLLATLGLLISAVVFGWAFFDPNRQGLHDKIAKTYVVVDDPRSE